MWDGARCGLCCANGGINYIRQATFSDRELNLGLSIHGGITVIVPEDVP